MSDAPEKTAADLALDIAKTVGEIHAEMIKLRRAGLPAKFLGGLSAVEDRLNVLADQNSALSAAVAAEKAA